MWLKLKWMISSNFFLHKIHILHSPKKIKLTKINNRTKISLQIYMQIKQKKTKQI